MKQSKNMNVIYMRGNVIQMFIETMKFIMTTLLLLSSLAALSAAKGVRGKFYIQLTSTSITAKTDPDEEYEYEEPVVKEKKNPC